MNDDFEFHLAPGHLIRRAQQIHTAVFAEEVSDPELTSPQFAVLAALSVSPGIDQVTLSQHLAVDRSTIADMASRLEEHGLIARRRDSEDARRNLLSLTAKGRKAFRAHLPQVAEVGRRLLDPLTPTQRKAFLASLTKIVAANDKWFAQNHGTYPAG